jgi:hypothetical protein
MTHRSFDPAPYKLIPFDPVPFFLAIASLAIAVNLLVLLGILLRSLKPSLAEHVKKLMWSAGNERRKEPYIPRERYADGAYEMDIGMGGSRGTLTPPKRTILSKNAVENDSAFLGRIWGPGGAAMRSSVEWAPT